MFHIYTIIWFAFDCANYICLRRFIICWCWSVWSSVRRTTAMFTKEVSCLLWWNHHISCKSYERGKSEQTKWFICSCNAFRPTIIFCDSFLLLFSFLSSDFVCSLLSAVQISLLFPFMWCGWCRAYFGWWRIASYLSTPCAVCNFIGAIHRHLSPSSTHTHTHGITTKHHHNRVLRYAGGHACKRQIVCHTYILHMPCNENTFHLSWMLFRLCVRFTFSCTFHFWAMAIDSSPFSNHVDWWFIESYLIACICPVSLSSYTSSEFGLLFYVRLLLTWMDLRDGEEEKNHCTYFSESYDSCMQSLSVVF